METERMEKEKEEEEEEEVVMSEVHLGCPPHKSGPFLSYFSFSLPPQTELLRNRCDEYVEDEPGSPQQLVDFDEDGDLILPRRSKQSCYSACISIQHNITSTIPSVGLQVWRAELILADFVLHTMFCSSIFNGIVALELGAGTGLVGIIIARVAETVFITDHGIEVLDNCATNVHVNSGMFRCESSVKVRELDWLNQWPPLSSEALQGIHGHRLRWRNILRKLMCQGSEKVLFLALEKRYNFSLSDLDVVANGYSHFLSYLTDKNGFTGKCIDLSDIPQYVREYERGNDVELWEIKYVAEKH